MRAPTRALIGLLALVVAVGCGRTSPDQGSTTVDFVTWKPNQPAVWDEAMRRFEAAHPDIHVRRQVGPHSSTAFHDLVTQKLKNRDSSVDVFFMDVIWPAEFAAAGWAKELSSRFPAADRDAFLAGPIAANTWRGGIYGVPAFIDAGMLYYRADLLSAHGFEPPSTWPELASQADAITAADPRRIAGYVGQFKQYEGLVCNMLELIASNGGRLVADDGRSATLTDPATLDAIRWARDTLVGSVAPRGVLTYEEPESLSVFASGRAVFLRSWPYAWQVSNDPERSRVAGRVGVTSLPHFAGQDSAATLGGWQYGISSYSDQPDAAWTFVAFMTSPEIQRFLATEASLAPTRSALFDDPAVLARNPQFADQAEAFRRAVPRPVTPVYPAVSAVLQRFFSRVLSDPGVDLEAAARQAQHEIDGYLEMVPSP